VSGDWITWSPGPSLGQPDVQLPEDFYLRELLELPVGDLEGAAELFRTYGLFFDLDRRELDLGSYSEEALEEVGAIPELECVGGPLRMGVHRDLVELHVQTAQSAI
jgi:hypothetical protein